MHVTNKTILPLRVMPGWVSLLPTSVCLKDISQRVLSDAGFFGTGTSGLRYGHQCACDKNSSLLQYLHLSFIVIVTTTASTGIHSELGFTLGSKSECVHNEDEDDIR